MSGAAGASLFRVAPRRSGIGHVVRTLGQCTVVWGATLGIGPYLIHAFEDAFAIHRFDFQHQEVLALVAFVLTSSLNLWSGATLALRGEGTPLPLECPRRLVVGGPYRYVRNPMALAGLGQGMSIAIGLGSWLTIAYVLAGGLVWHFLLRVAEERDLTARFGASYESYRRDVPLWIPRLTRFAASASP